jgi:hypothetical protein
LGAVAFVVEEADDGIKFERPNLDGHATLPS